IFLLIFKKYRIMIQRNESSRYAMQTIERTYSPTVAHRLMQEGLPPLLARLFAARGIERTDWLKNPLAGLLPWQTLKNADAAARLLVEIIEKRIPTVIVADYD